MGDLHEESDIECTRKLILGDCVEKMRAMPDCYLDSIVTDPPYGWRFVGKAWDGDDIKKHANWAINKAGPKVMADGRVRNPRPLMAEAAGKYDQTVDGNKAFQIFTQGWAKEAFRVLKPGGYALVFCGPRTYHRMASGVEDAGFEIRDQLQWLFGSGFPKSHNLDGNFEGWGTALKPANEPIVLARKPLSEKTVALNVAKWGCGALNIDGSRIEANLENDDMARGRKSNGKMGFSGNEGVRIHMTPNAQGRWPANLILDETAAEILDAQSGLLHSRPNAQSKRLDASPKWYENKDPNKKRIQHDISGGASRFFYIAKASKRERNAGCEGMPKQVTSVWGGEDDDLSEGKKSTIPRANHHPTVKPIKLMEYLCRLITPPKGLILDPFMGSGTTGIAAKNLGFGFIGIEMNADYFEIAKRRIINMSAT